MDHQAEALLPLFGINSVKKIDQIYRSAWDIDDTYILKKNSNLEELQKSIKLSDLLVRENIPVRKYLRTLDDKPFIQIDNDYYSLMTKLNGYHIDPYKADQHKTGRKLGNIIATLHLALSKIEDAFDVYDAHYPIDFSSWILSEIKTKAFPVRQEIIDYCFSFEALCNTLPRQLIHRDMHLLNLIFDDDHFVGYLDFDISQRNIRILDLCYLSCSLLVENYRDDERVTLWREIFDGIITGYDELIPLSDDEKKAFPYLFVLIEMTFIAYFSQIGQADFAYSAVDMTSWLFDHIDKLQMKA